MNLTVPQRTIADTGSFPVNPEGVTQWLAELRPLDSETDARELYRGLKHSNRLHNDVAQRRSVISCFVPVLRELHRYLSELSNSQPLPLTREFARSARLRDSLLREEAFAFKILLADSETPLVDDARRAMQALARQAEAAMHGYRACPDALIEDAHQLYALAEEHDLLSVETDSDVLTLQDHYRYILLLSIADLAQQRARQLPLVMEFLKSCVAEIDIKKQRSTEIIGKTEYAINLTAGSRPEPALSLLAAQPSDLRWFSVAPILRRIHQESPNDKVTTATVVSRDVLERQSLARLHVVLARTRQRRQSRCITWQPQHVIFGHKQICAHLLYRNAEPAQEPESDWAMVNHTAQGMCLSSSLCRAGLVQVGELISVTDLNPTEDSDEKHQSVSLGVVRWIRANGDQGIHVGVEFLSRSVLAVRVTRVQSESQPPDASQTNVIDIGEHALIIACKVKNSVLQTMLLPSFLYQVDDKLIATQGSRSRKFQLIDCLQSNGLFSQYSLG